jgi:hypothetical protein
MKNLTTKMMIAAAALVAVAGVASAQTMEAKIPFAFRAGGTVLPAGTYRVEMLRGPSGSPFLVIRGQEPGQQVQALTFPNGYAKKAWTSSGDPVLSFQCGVGRCALRDVWMGDEGRPVYQIPVPSLGKDEPRSVAEIVMHPVNGD